MAFAGHGACTGPILLNIACQVVGPQSGRGRSQGIKYSGTPGKEIGGLPDW